MCVRCGRRRRRRRAAEVNVGKEREGESSGRWPSEGREEMESAEAKKQRSQRNRRRQRAARLQQQRQAATAAATAKSLPIQSAIAASAIDAVVVVGQDGTGGGGENAPIRRRPLQPQKTRKKRNKDTSIVDEDIIDGFAIFSFKTYEDLENTVKSMAKKMAGTEDLCPDVTSLSMAASLQKVADAGPTTAVSKSKSSTLKLLNNNNNNNNSNNATNNNSNHLLLHHHHHHHHNKKLSSSPSRTKTKIHNTPNDTGGASDDNVKTEDEISTIIALNGPQHSDSRDRLSDEVSSRPSSGRGYIVSAHPVIHYICIILTIK